MSDKYKIIKSEFINTNYPINKKYIHWSRIYEWEYVMNNLNGDKHKTLHNTSCGGLDEGDCLHLTFCGDIDNVINDTTHSDLWGGTYKGVETKPTGDNFIYYDITKPLDKKFDMVLNISTLEHLNNGEIVKALDNLMEQVSNGGEMILTFDYPDIQLKVIEDYFNVKISKSGHTVTNGNLSIVLIHLEKL